VCVQDDDLASACDSLIVTVNNDTFRVVSFTATASGFDIAFNRAASLSPLNLYDGLDQNSQPSSQPADIVVTGPGGEVRGSMTWNAATNSVSFVQTGGVLAAGSYTVTLRSAADAWQDGSASLLDGDGINGAGDFTAGGDYVHNFTVAASSTRVLSIPDFTRGAGQPVNVPASGTGLPIKIDNANGVTSVDFDLVYNPALLHISAVNLAPGVSWTTPVVNNIAPGHIRVTAFGSAANALSGSDVSVLVLTADVPVDAPYADNEVVRLEAVKVNGVNSRGDFAVHKAAYLGDVDANGSYDSNDAALLSRVVVGFDSGFHQHDWTDPVIVADTDGDGVLTGQDTSDIFSQFFLISLPNVPAVPTGVTIAPRTAGYDPSLSIDANIEATAGQRVRVPVMLDTLEASGVYSASFEVLYDPNVLDLSNFDVQSGEFWGASAGWTLGAQVIAPGRVRIGAFNAQSSTLGSGDIAMLDFMVKPNAPAGDTLLDIRKINEAEGGLSWTIHDGSLTISSSMLPGDANLDGRVDRADAAIVASNFGRASGATRGQGDFNGDGMVTLADLMVVQNNLGTGNFSQSPAPSAAASSVVASARRPATVAVQDAAHGSATATRRLAAQTADAVFGEVGSGATTGSKLAARRTAPRSAANTASLVDSALSSLTTKSRRSR
jgi:hypothetical protein